MFRSLLNLLKRRSAPSDRPTPASAATNSAKSHAETVFGPRLALQGSAMSLRDAAGEEDRGAAESRASVVFGPNITLQNSTIRIGRIVSGNLVVNHPAVDHDGGPVETAPPPEDAE